ncbi:MAG: hypothetical protein AMXMBFR58_09810 [Phycisphaerae bacterium]|nr:hypothetical protein [Phycisphaerales bacterium]MCK6475397.1 hypothetical protein [Phycisphaerales bacterium]
MATQHLNLLRRACTAGRLLGIAGLLCAAAIMLSVFNQPAALSGWAAGAVFGVILLAFLADRLLTSVLDRVDRFEHAQLESRVSADQHLRDAA